MVTLDSSKLMLFISVFAILFQIIVLLTNVIVQAIKGVLLKIPANVLALLVAEMLVMVILFAAAAIVPFKVVWYMVVGMLILGLTVAYAAMYGYDKLLCSLFNKVVELSKK